MRSASLGWPRIGSKTACASENNAWITSVFMMLIYFYGYSRRIHYIVCFCTCCCARFSISIFDCDLVIKNLKYIFIIGVRFSIAIFARTFLHLRSSRELFFDCDLQLRSSREHFDLRANFSGIAIFDCDLCAILRSVRRPIFDCDLRANFSLDAPRSDAVFFGVSFAFGRCLFWRFFRTMRELTRLFRTPCLS